MSGAQLDVVLVRPPYQLTEFDQVPQEPLGLCYVAAAMRHAGLGVKIIDAEFDDLDADETLGAISQLEPAVVGLSVMSRGALASALAIAAGVRAWAAPGAHITMGGIVPSFAAQEVLRLIEELDSVVRFEGEVAGTALVRAVVGGAEWRGVPGVAFRPHDGPAQETPHNTCVDINCTPAPVRDLLPKALSLGRACCVSTSRGCAGNCSFCAMPSFYRGSGRARRQERRVDLVLDEIEYLVTECDTRDLNFVDDDFVGDRAAGHRRAGDVAQGLIDRGLDIWYEFETRPDCVDKDLFRLLRESGLRSVFVGVESVAPNAQRAFRKVLDRETIEQALDVLRGLGIDFRVGYIMFHPHTTLDEIETSLAFLKDHGQATPHSLTNTLHVDCGTPILVSLASEGLLSGDGLVGYRCLCADDRVGELRAVATIAVRPLFPAWYEGVQRISSLRTRMHSGQAGQSLLGELRDATQETNAVASLACEVFQEALRSARRNAHADPCAYALGLRDDALVELSRRLTSSRRSEAPSGAAHGYCPV